MEFTCISPAPNFSASLAHNIASKNFFSRPLSVNTSHLFFEIFFALIEIIRAWLPNSLEIFEIMDLSSTAAVLIATLSAPLFKAFLTSVIFFNPPESVTGIKIFLVQFFKNSNAVLRPNKLALTSLTVSYTHLTLPTNREV